MTFQFRLESVLKLRQHERERQRQSVTLARQRHAEFTAKRDDITQARLAVIKELRQMNRDDVWAVEQIHLRQNHVEILNQDLLDAESDVVRAESDLAECLKRLISADQAASALERLAELQRAEFLKNDARIEARNFDDLVRPDRRVG
jgi:flagellar export protein FliJ